MSISSTSETWEKYCRTSTCSTDETNDEHCGQKGEIGRDIMEAVLTSKAAGHPCQG